ncbi:hypothetical protein EDD18DRAFT_1344574 [Armillaria luteobubalina]|uniref:Secreted protein n=1 Tax=Armillaria luteobubalina TaxID=153913 RepID=A0AA39V363_9AGAR|nr:hypothetical protein EDD18DRAFT_1344574 [Armillaria luteobubalina]
MSRHLLLLFATLRVSALGPASQSVATGSTHPQLSPSFNITLSGIDFPPVDLTDAMLRTKKICTAISSSVWWKAVGRTTQMSSPVPLVSRGSPLSSKEESVKYLGGGGGGTASGEPQFSRLPPYRHTHLTPPPT